MVVPKDDDIQTCFGFQLKTKIIFIVQMSMTFVFMVVEIIVANITKSETLMADALHMLSDFLSMIVGFVAEHMKEQSLIADKQLIDATINGGVRAVRGLPPYQTGISKPISKTSDKWKNLLKGVAPAKYTFSYHRAETIGGFINAIILLVLMCQLVVGATSRMLTCPGPITEPKMLLVTGLLGLAINIIGIILFTQFGMTHSHGGQECQGHGHSHASAPAKEKADQVAMDQYKSDQILKKNKRFMNYNKKGINRPGCEDSKNSTAALLPSIGENFSEPSYLLQNTNSVEDPKVNSRMYAIQENNQTNQHKHGNSRIRQSGKNSSNLSSHHDNRSNAVSGVRPLNIKIKKPGRVKIEEPQIKIYFEKGEHYECEPLQGCNSTDADEIRRCPVRPDNHRHSHRRRNYDHNHNHMHDNGPVDKEEDDDERVFIEENQLKTHSSHGHTHDHSNRDTPYDNGSPEHVQDDHHACDGHDHNHAHDGCCHSHGPRSRKKVSKAISKLFRTGKKKTCSPHGHSHDSNKVPGDDHQHSHGNDNHGHSHDDVKTKNNDHDHGHGHTHGPKSSCSGGGAANDHHGHSHGKKGDKEHVDENLNIRGVVLHLIGDALGSVAVVFSAILHIFYEHKDEHKKTDRLIKDKPSSTKDAACIEHSYSEIDYTSIKLNEYIGPSGIYERFSEEPDESFEQMARSALDYDNEYQAQIKKELMQFDVEDVSLIDISETWMNSLIDASGFHKSGGHSNENCIPLEHFPENWLNYVDPLISLILSFFVIKATLTLCSQAFPVLMEASGSSRSKNSLRKASDSLRNHLSYFGLNRRYKIRNMHTWQLNSQTYCIAFRLIYSDDRGRCDAANECIGISNQLRHMLTKGDDHDFKYCFIDIIASSNIDYYTDQTELFPMDTVETTMDVSLRNSQRPSAGLPLSSYNQQSMHSHFAMKGMGELNNSVNNDSNLKQNMLITSSSADISDACNNHQVNSPPANESNINNNQLKQGTDPNEYDNICANSQMDDICVRFTTSKNENENEK